MAGTRKLGKTTDQRLAMLKTLTTDLILNGKVVTTVTRAKEVKALKNTVVSKVTKDTGAQASFKMNAGAGFKDVSSSLCGF